MRILIVIVALISFFAWELPTTKWGYEMTKAEERKRNGEDVDMSELRKGPAPMRWWKDRTELNDIFNTTYLSDRRRVTVKVKMPMEELLSSDEPMPEEVFKEVFAAARGPAQLITICNELLRTIASKCDLSKPSSRIGPDGLAELTGLLRFVPADDPGALPQAENADYVDLRVSLNSKDPVPYTAETREDALRVAGLLCRALRNVVGNCIVTHVRLMPKEFRRIDEETLFLDANAVLTVYADPDKTDDEALKTALVLVRKSVGL